MDVEDSKDDLLKDIVAFDVAEQAESMDTDMFWVFLWTLLCLCSIK